MSEFNQFQDRVDKLTLFYMHHTCDISSMSIEEYIKTFNETAEKIVDAYNNNTRYDFLVQS